MISARHYSSMLCRLLGGIVLFAATTASAQCTLCADGSPYNTSAVSVFDGTPCTTLSALADDLSPSPDDTCAALQLVGFLSCDCPTPPTSSNGDCKICPDGSDLPNPDLEILEFDTTCGIAELFGTFVEQSECASIQQFAYYCGCPGVEPSCTACPDGSMVSNPDVVIPIPGVDMIPGVDVTCAFAEGIASFSPNETACFEFQMDFGTYTQGNICGCTTDPADFVYPTTTSGAYNVIHKSLALWEFVTLMAAGLGLVWHYK